MSPKWRRINDSSTRSSCLAEGRYLLPHARSNVSGVSPGACARAERSSSCYSDARDSGTGAPAATPAAEARNVTPKVDAQGWDDFWHAHGVGPSPPRGFLDAPEDPLPEIVNATAGLVDDATVRRWILADLRRGRGDDWASRHLRIDVARANLFGPPGLNGTDDGIWAEALRGVVEIRCAEPRTVISAAAVVSVPRDVQAENPWAGLTDYVIVLRREQGAGLCERAFRDGHFETMAALHPTGSPTWQLDTGSFREAPVIGSLWYQAHGWSCVPDPAGTPIGRLCAVLATPSQQ